MSLPKSILKKPTYKPSPLRQSTPTPTDTVSITPPPKTGSKPSPEEARLIALSHAHALQIRKALELSILTSLEELVDYPTVPHTATALKQHLRYFQPSDYDSLIEERNILTRCGYALCALAMPAKSASKYILVDKGRASMRFVERSKLERFCSDTCARRALWLRVQLNDEPSWLRGDVLEGVEVGEKGEVYGLDLDGAKWSAEGGEGTMTLLEDVEAKRDGGVKGADLKKLVEELQGLGIESKGLLKGSEVEIEEREVADVAVPPEVVTGMAALAIEGYTPRRGPEDYAGRKKKAGE